MDIFEVIKKERAELVQRLNQMLAMQVKRAGAWTAFWAVFICFWAHTTSTLIKFISGVSMMAWVSLKHFVCMPFVMLYVWFDGLLVLRWFYGELRRK